MNESRTCADGGAELTRPCSLSVPEIRRHLSGRRLTCAPVIRPYISNLIAQLGTWETGESRPYLRGAMETNIQRIEGAMG